MSNQGIGAGPVGESEIWAAIDSLKASMGDHRGGAVPIWEAWCEENGVDWADLRAVANAYLPSFKQWLDDSCLREAAVDMWLHAFQVGLLVARSDLSQFIERLEGEADRIEAKCEDHPEVSPEGAATRAALGREAWAIRRAIKAARESEGGGE